LENLSVSQRKAIDFLNGKAIVNSIPGSGKTRVITQRILKMIKEYNIEPESIIAMAFSRSAASEMRQRLLPVLGDQAQRIMLSTIHSFCHWLLRNEGHTFEVLTGKDQLQFMRGIMKSVRVKDLSLGMILSEISLAKINMIDANEFRELYFDDKTMQKVADVYEAYELEKSKKFLKDFDDLIYDSYKLLSTDQKIRDKYRERFLHLLIDEFQDVNPLQNEILMLLINESDNGSFFCVGDSDQAIYGFAGCTAGNILNFNNTFQDAETFVLNVNFRSTKKIIRACQNLIQHNVQKVDKELITYNEEGDDVIVLEASSEESEALSLVNEISELLGKGYKLKDIGILYRNNFQSRILEEVLSQHQIPYRIESGLNFYHRPEVRHLLDYLQVIDAPDSTEADESLKAILNIPNRYVSRKFINELVEFSNKRKIHLYQGLKEIGIDLPYVRKNVKAFTSLLDPLIELQSNMGPAEIIGILRDSLDYDRFVSDEDLPNPDDPKVQNIAQCQMAASRYSSIKPFLEFTDSFQDENVTDNHDGISLMTIHKSKGLEFPAIFLVGMVEGILPTRKAENLEEERRVAFVGLSRARKLLFLSYSHTYLGQPSKMSQFVNEILGLKNPEISNQLK